MNITKLSTEQIRLKLRKISIDYKFAPQITGDIELKFRNEATPLIEELNLRLLKTWEQMGGTVVAKNPMKITFQGLIKHGI